MKLVWSPETALKAYIDTVKSVSTLYIKIQEPCISICHTVFLLLSSIFSAVCVVVQ